MKDSAGNNAFSNIVLVTPEHASAQGGPQSIFSLLLDIESRLRREARNNAQTQSRPCDIFKVKGQKGSRVEKLSRYIE